MSFAEQMAELAKLRADFAAENARINKLFEEEKKLREEQEKNLKNLKEIQDLANKLSKEQALKNAKQPSAKIVSVMFVPYAYYTTGWM